VHQIGAADTSLNHVNDLPKFHIHLRQEMMRSMKQPTLENLFRSGASK